MQLLKTCFTTMVTNNRKFPQNYSLKNEKESKSSFWDTYVVEVVEGFIYKHFQRANKGLTNRVGAHVTYKKVTFFEATGCNEEIETLINWKFPQIKLSVTSYNFHHVYC